MDSSVLKVSLHNFLFDFKAAGTASNCLAWSARLVSVRFGSVRFGCGLFAFKD